MNHNWFRMPSRSCRSIKIYELKNFWFIVKVISIVFIIVWYNLEGREDSFSNTCFWHEIVDVMKRNSKLSSLDISIWYPFWQISWNLSKFLLDILEYKTSFICNFAPFSDIILVLSKPSIRLAARYRINISLI